MQRSTLAFPLLIALVSIALVLVVLVLVVLGVDSVRAQQPTSEQRNAIRSACRSDFIANCAGVEPGGKEAFECLLRSHDNLSASCKAAVDAVAAKLQTPAAPTAGALPPTAAPPPAVAPSPGAAPSPAANASQTAAPATATPPPSRVTQEELNAVRGACTLNDIAEHCSWIAPSSPEIVLCLQANLAGLSSGCRAAVSGSGAPPNAAAEPSPAPASAIPPARQNSREASPSRAATAAAPGAASGARPGKPTAAQTAAIRSACRSDFMANCSGVQPGGPAALQCLQSNAPKLSQACRTAIAAVGGAPSGAVPSPATAEAPAAAPLRPRGFIPLQNRLVVLRICRPDVVALCAGTPPGGGQIIDCLAANARSLSPDCYAAVAGVSR
jgi:hypothetical protein